ncbi:methyl-accepting chemotaxis sensory transducer, partial [Idiomarina xiamenensis 10-D-4]
LTAAVEEVARNAVATSQDSDDADERAAVGRQQVEQTITTVNDLLTDLADTMSGVNALASQVKNIGSVLDVIRAI